MTRRARDVIQGEIIRWGDKKGGTGKIFPGNLFGNRGHLWTRGDAGWDWGVGSPPSPPLRLPAGVLGEIPPFLGVGDARGQPRGGEKGKILICGVYWAKKRLK